MPTPATNLTTIYDQYGLPLPTFMDTKETTSGVSGTASPSTAIEYSFQNPVTGAVVTTNNPYMVPIQELSDSPSVEVAEQCTTTKSFEVPYSYATDMMPLLARGTLFRDSFDNYNRILTVRLQRQRTTKAILTIVTESVSFDTPPDEFSCTPVELGVNIMKHPRYFYALYPDPDLDTLLERQVKRAIIRTIQTYQDSPFSPSADYLNGSVQNQILNALSGGTITYTPPNSGSGTPTIATYNPATGGSASIALAIAAAGEIIQKLWRLEDNPYMVGWQISWSTYYYRPPILTPGGYLQDPILDTDDDNPGLPDYFYSTSNPPTTVLDADIFSEMAALNPQCYSNNGTPSGTINISWLRKADDIDYQRTWFKVTRTWIGSAIGHWDTQLFGGGVEANNYSPNRPSHPYDYLPIS